MRRQTKRNYFTRYRDDADKELLGVAVKIKKLLGLCMGGISALITENQKMVDGAKFIRIAKKLASYVNMMTDAKAALNKASDAYLKERM